MQTTVHLISMPMSVPNRPSIQLGALKAYLDGTDLGVQVHTYSAFLGILALEPDSALDAMIGAPFFDQIDALGACLVSAQLDSSLGSVISAPTITTIGEVRTTLGEAPYFLLYYEKYLRQSHADLEDESKPYGGVIEFQTPRAEEWFRTAFGSDGLHVLRDRTDAYIETRIIPQLSQTGLNVVGFTCTFEQTYASLYCLRYLLDRCPDVRFLFVFGGSAMGLPATQECLQALEVDTLCVIGEGERKLEAIVRHCLLASEDIAPSAIRIAAPGVVHVSDSVDYYDKQQALYDGQIDKLDALPPPDYDEYFAEFRRHCVSDTEYHTTLQQVEIQLEGSRGCVFHCTFCNLNYLWDGYRSQTAVKILETTAIVTKKYAVDGMKLRFVDNLCNWSASVAQLAVERGLRFPAFLELRAKYPEDFWVKLDRIGVWAVQVGIEAYSTALLGLMEKKTRAMDNVRAHKYMTELGITHTSNLISRYPESTLEMIEESRRVCSYISHFSKLDFSPFMMVAGSPLYNRLPRETREGMRPTGEIKLHDNLLAYFAGFIFRPPAELMLPPAVDEAWTHFEKWYRGAVKQRHRFTVERIGDARRLVDTRGGDPKEAVITGPAVRILDACHKPLTVAEIAEATSLELDVVRSAIAELNETRVLLHLDDEYINVALRPKHEVTAAFESKRSKRPAALAVMQP